MFCEKQTRHFMIEKINITSVDKKNTPVSINKKTVESQPSFKGGMVDLLVKGVQKCEEHPMLNVSVLDLSTAIIPRTIIETTAGSNKKDKDGKPIVDENGKRKRQFNWIGGFEALRREGSGLLINCIFPSFIVMGTGTLFNWPIMRKFDKNLINNWANGEAYDKILKFYKSGEQNEVHMKDFFKRSILSLEGVDGKAYENGGVKSFAMLLADNPEEIKGLSNIDDIVSKICLKTDAEDAINILAKAANDGNYENTKKAYRKLVELTHISENIRFAGEEGFLGNNLYSFCKDTPKVLHGAKARGIKNTEDLGVYFKNAKKLVNWKSIGGLGLIIPLAISAQPINRWITHKISGRKGAPIYNDYDENKEYKEPTKTEKLQLLKQKVISISSMLGVCGLSMVMDKPSLKSLFQFKGLFPTMDQARIISTATFASRMGAAEDKNELQESTIRDIATFSSFYFLGDYAAKGIASFIESRSKGKVTLINRLKKLDDNANVLQKFWNWAKHTSLKSTDELATAHDKRLRTICQLGNIAFSLISLGLFIPLYTRTQAQKNKAKQDLAKLNAGKSNAASGGAGTLAAASSSNLSMTGAAAANSTFKKAFMNS